MRLENGNVIPGEASIPLTDLEVFGDKLLVVRIGDSFIPEEDCTAEEKEVFNAWRELYPNGKPQPPVETTIISEPIDEEKAALAEAAIFLSDELDKLKAEIELLKGGVSNA